MTGHRFLFTALLAAILAGCGGNPEVPDPDPAGSGVAGSGSDSSSRGVNDSGFGEGEEFGDAMGRGELDTVIYFDFDQSELRPEYGDLLARHAQRLANNASTKVRLEGHADERGSREYNIGLGERRSQSVRRMLLIQGASAEQIATVSFGEERPAELGSDEDAYAQNRRVEIKYTN